MVDNDDSDVELDEELGEEGKYRMPIRRRLLEEEEDEAPREERDGEWKEGVSWPAGLPFAGEQGLQVEMEEDLTPFDFLRLMISEDMMKEITTETNQ